jgi:hypothetical protein
MRQGYPQLSSTKHEGSMIFYIPKPILRFGYASFLLLAVIGHAAAQQVPSSQVGAEPLPDNPQGSGTTDNSQNSGNSQNNSQNNSQDNSQDNGNGNGNGNSQARTGSQNPDNPSAGTTPVIPQAVGSPYAPLSFNADGQPTQYTTNPALYTTGSFDVSQIATSEALTRAFGGTSTGLFADQGPSFSNPPIERIRLGPFDLKSAVTMTLVEDDNIQGGQGTTSSNGSTTGSAQKESDTIFGFTPAILLIYGNHDGQRGFASLVYAPTLTRYYHHSSNDSDNQNVSFAGNYPLQRLSFNVSDTFTQVTGVNQDIAARTTQTSNIGELGANYEVDDRLSVNTQFQNLTTTYSDGGGNGDTISQINSTVAYILSDKITIGPELVLGIEKPDNSSDQTFEQGLVAATYQATDKISMSGSGGVEIRQSKGGQGLTANNDGSETSTDPVFGLGVSYAPFDSTSLSLSGYQAIQASSGALSENVTNTGIGFSVSQRFFHRIYTGFTFTYQHSEYRTNLGGQVPTGAAAVTATGSSQDNYVYRPSIGFAPTLWSSLTLYYQYQENESDGTVAGYHDNQLGLSFSAEF